ncbi:MAG: FecR domain-containing protein [Bacteroidota bacterium]|nr:FecR domain-containing protein [Bacteroidota bacterium]
MIKRDTYHHLPEAVLEGLPEDERYALQATWNLCGNISPSVERMDASSMKANIMAQVSAQTVADRPALRLVTPSVRVHQLRMRIVSVAAALVVGLSMMLSGSSQHFAAPHGDQSLTVTLDDGSQVRLAPGSRLSVPASFGETDRSVSLNGEAFFDVAESPVPFSVRTEDSRTTVLGTSFNVRSWPRSLLHATEVIVASGRVSVAAGELQTIVEPGQSVTASEKALTPVDTDADARLAWIQGGFSYENELIGNVLDDVERRFDVRVKAPASIRLRPISIHRNHVEGASEFLGDIAATISVRYRPNANGFELYLD